MASVISEKRGGRTRYRIQFRDGDNKRKSIRLSGANKRTADAIASKVESLNACCIAGHPMPTDLAKWVVNLGDDLHDKLANAGLVQPRQSSTLAAFIDGYIASRSNVEERTRINWQLTRRKLTAFLGENRDLRNITDGDADDWRQWLATEYSEATVAGHVKSAKHFFKYALRKRLVESNPFTDLRGGRMHNDERQAFIGRDVITKVVEHCPDCQWRLIVALCRYGGLRCPSEVLRLTWADIDWQNKRFTVTSNKTRKQGKGSRIVPLFPELEPFLAEAFEPEDTYCITKYRSQDVNLRTQLQRILVKARVDAWPRLFHNLRASRQTELENQFPTHVVCSWLGNSPQTASRHYLQTTDEHFVQAVGGAGGGAASCRNDKRAAATANAKPRENKGKAINLGLPQPIEYAQQDSNLRPAD